MLTREQLQQNIQAMEQQGASQEEVQAYINSTSVQNTPQPQNQSFLKNVGNTLISSEKNFGRTLGDVGANLSGTGNKINEANQRFLQTGNDLLKLAQSTQDPEKKKQRLELARKSFEQAGVNWKDVLPSIQKTNTQIIGEAAGVGLDALTVGTLGKKAVAGGVNLVKDIAKAKDITSVGAGFLKGAKEGLKIATPLGAAYGATGAMQEGTSPVQGAITGAIGGAVVGSTLSGILGGVSARMSNLAAKNLAKAQEAANKILLGTTKDIAPGIKALSKLETNGVKHFDDLAEVVGSKIQLLAQMVDDKLAQDPTTHKLLDLTQKTMVGNKKVAFNYVSEALKGLNEFYQKAADPESAARISQLLSKARTEGLTSLEINNIAREFGVIFTKKAFSKVTNEPLTSVGLQAAENIRKGIKKTSRALAGEATAALDKEMTRLIRVRELLNTSVEKVNKLSQRIQSRNIFEKLGRHIGSAINYSTGGGLKSLYARAFFPSNIGLKTANILDLENQLSKNLKIIQRLENSGDNALFNYFKSLGPKIKELFNETKTPLGPLPKGNPAETGKTKFLSNFRKQEGAIKLGGDISEITPKNIKVFRGEGSPTGISTYTSGQYFADTKEFAGRYGKVKEDVIPRGSKIFNFDTIKGNPDQKIIPQDILLDPKATQKWLVDHGYDYSKNTNVNGVEYVKLKTGIADTMMTTEQQSARIQQLQILKDNGGLLTKSELNELNDFNNSALLKEATKYKTAEEFVKAQQEKLPLMSDRMRSDYVRNPAEKISTNDLTPAKNNLLTQDNDFVYVKETPDYLVMTEKWTSGSRQGLMDKYGKSTNDVVIEKLTPRFEEIGKIDGLEMVSHKIKNGNSVVIYKKPKSQLTDIWNKANKVKSKIVSNDLSRDQLVENVKKELPKIHKAVKMDEEAFLDDFLKKVEKGKDTVKDRNLAEEILNNWNMPDNIYKRKLGALAPFLVPTGVLGGAVTALGASRRQNSQKPK